MWNNGSIQLEHIQLNKAEVLPLYFITQTNAMAGMMKLKMFEPFQNKSFLQGQNTILLKYLYVILALNELKCVKSHEMRKPHLNSVRFGKESVVRRTQVRAEKMMFFLQKRKKILLCPKGHGLQMRTVLSADTSGHFCNIIL